MVTGGETGGGRQPALDGLRGVAVALVLAFHGGYSWASAGYLGVSVFFTLSGFLITRLLADEYDSTGRIDLGRFWSRRIRRLLPAGLACLAAVSALRATGRFSATIDLTPSVVGAALQVANWVQLAGEQTYTELLRGAQNPLTHYWSLSIEEQFYWLWPLVFLAAAKAGRRDATVAVATVAAIGAAPLIAWRWTADAAYWSTPARASEILVGALLALAWRARPVGAGVANWFGLGGAAAIAWFTIRWPADHGPAYSGWLPVVAAASAAVIAGLLADGWFARVFRWRALVGLGAISYGVYLYHWPIFVLVDEAADRSTITFAAKVGVTFVVAAASARWLERPFREAQLRIRPVAAGAVLTTAAVALVGLALPRNDDPFAGDEFRSDGFSAIDDPTPLRAEPTTDLPPTTSTPPTVTTEPATTSPDAPSTVPPTTKPPTTVPAPTTDVPGDRVELPPLPARPVRVLVVGDSVAWSLKVGLDAWAEAHPGYLDAAHEVSISCGFIRDAGIPAFAGRYDEACDELLDDRVPAVVATSRPDLVVLMSTRADAEPHVWDPSEGALPATDSRFAERQLADYVRFADQLRELGAGQVVWLTPPTVRDTGAVDEAMTDPVAMAALRDAVRLAAATSDPPAALVDLAGWYDAAGLDDLAARPDGIHFDGNYPSIVAERFLAATLLDIALDNQHDGEQE